jgi:hypothetical protein
MTMDEQPFIDSLLSHQDEDATALVYGRLARRPQPGRPRSADSGGNHGRQGCVGMLTAELFNSAVVTLFRGRSAR